MKSLQKQSFKIKQEKILNLVAPKYNTILNKYKRFHIKTSLRLFSLYDSCSM